MKTRIKIIEKADGSKLYIPQKKGFAEYDTKGKLYALGLPILGWMLGLAIILVWDDISYSDGFLTIEEAKDCIDQELLANQRALNRKNANKIRSVKYVKYP